MLQLRREFVRSFRRLLFQGFLCGLGDAILLDALLLEDVDEVLAKFENLDRRLVGASESLGRRSWEPVIVVHGAERSAPTSNAKAPPQTLFIPLALVARHGYDREILEIHAFSIEVPLTVSLVPNTVARSRPHW